MKPGLALAMSSIGAVEKPIHLRSCGTKVDVKSLSLSLLTGGARCPEEVFGIIAGGR